MISSVFAFARFALRCARAQMLLLLLLASSKSDGFLRLLGFKRPREKGVWLQVAQLFFEPGEFIWSLTFFLSNWSINIKT